MRSSVMSAFDIRTNATCNLCIQKLQGASQQEAFSVNFRKGFMPFVWLAGPTAQEKSICFAIASRARCWRTGLWEKDWENVAESPAKRKGQHHEGIRFEAVSFVDDRFDLGNATDKSVYFLRYGSDGQISRLGKENLVGSRFAACMWTSTKAVICNRHEKHAKYLMPPPSLVKKRKFWWRSLALSRGACCAVLVTDKSQSRTFEQWHTIVEKL